MVVVVGVAVVVAVVLSSLSSFVGTEVVAFAVLHAVHACLHHLSLVLYQW